MRCGVLAILSCHGVWLVFSISACVMHAKHDRVSGGMLPSKCNLCVCIAPLGSAVCVLAWRIGACACLDDLCLGAHLPV